MPHLSLRLFGSLDIRLDDQPITGLAYDKVWALLIYLAQGVDHRHRRESLAALLWPDQPERRALTNLRQALARLRQVSGDADATPPFLLIDRSSLQLNAAGDYSSDVAEFTMLLTACASHSHRHAATCAACAERRQRAVALYRGAFLDDFYIGDSDLFEEWATVVRERLHQQALDALAALVAYHERLGNYAEALQYGERQLELDPWREEAYRQIMRILALNGQRSAALHRYERCRTLLAQELGVEPSSETTALYEQIRASELGEPGNLDHLALPTKHRHNLPPQPTPFVGRELELAALADLLANPKCRLITLVGPGGVGKTRLALQTASDEGATFADGTVYVSLAPLSPAEFLAPAVAAALDVTLSHYAAPDTELLHYLRQKEMLLLLDNFEHLLSPVSSSPGVQHSGDATAFVNEILTHAPGVKLLVTSRERLNLQGEWVFEVGGLAAPAGPYGADVGQASAFEAYSAVALFLQTARRVRQGFVPTAVDRAAIVRICQLVQGMPLALELAAAWVRVVPCREIAQEIGKNLGFLATTLRDLPERHRSMQAVFDHSWGLLSAEEQRAFACCSVFRGGFTREAASEVAGASLPLLAALVDKSLLRRDLRGRYEVHELARQYGAARLADTHQEVQTRSRHLQFFMHFAERAEPGILGGDQVAHWHEWVELEHDNLRAALEWSLRGGEIEPGLRVVGALWYFWMNRGHAPEGQNWAERFLAHPAAAAPTHLRARALHTAGVCAFYHGRYRTALSWLEEAAAIGRDLGASGRYVRSMALVAQSYTLFSIGELDAVQALSEETLRLGEELQVGWVKGDALNQLAALAWRRGDYTTAHRRFLETLEHLEEIGDELMRGVVLRRLAVMLYEQGDYAAAHACLGQGLAIFEELTDKVRISGTLTRLGHVAIASGSEREAQEYFTRALATIRETGHLLDRIHPLDALGRLTQRQGAYERARSLHLESMALAVEMDHQAWCARILEGFACLAVREGNTSVGVHLFAAAELHAAPLEALIDPAWSLEHDRMLASARAQLGEATFTAAWAAGATMSLAEAVKLAQREVSTQSGSHLVGYGVPNTTS